MTPQGNARASFLFIAILTVATVGQALALHAIGLGHAYSVFLLAVAIVSFCAFGLTYAYRFWRPLPSLGDL